MFIVFFFTVISLEEGSINVILPAAARSIQKVRISKLTAGRIQVKNRTNAHGKDVPGVLPGPMNLPDIFVNILELNHLNVNIVNEHSAGQIIWHCI